mmetsp:Transcript_2018/g.7286  ORF Transcript_2018/g.7286 Transcript_2018/m.7286 type:complete len:551 (-) Transcript_2018:28-1680(-)
MRALGRQLWRSQRALGVGSRRGTAAATGGRLWAAGEGWRGAGAARWLCSAPHAGDGVVPPPRAAVEVTPPQAVPSEIVKDMSMQSVVKVFCDSSSAIHALPWQMKPPQLHTGSGFAIEHGGRRMIMTNAHVVADHKFVTLRKHGNPEKYPAHVLAIGHDCDLAVLDVRDDEFWQGMQALEFGDIPKLQDTCILVGFPTGGDTLSITRGIVSRVEMQSYAHSSSYLLAIQVDAAVNSGNSGGPAVYNDRVMGVAFQNLVGASNVGYVIPVPIVLHFLEDLKRNNFEYKGFGVLGISTQVMENPQMREHFGMQPSMTGVLVRGLPPMSPAAKHLKVNDVILKLDDTRIANDGTIPFRDRERMDFGYLVSEHYQGETMKLHILRDKKELTVEVEVGPWDPLVPVRFHDKLPPYFIHAGFVFSTLSQQFISEWYGEEWRGVPWKLVHAATEGRKKTPGEEVVVISQVLSHEVNWGYAFLREMPHQVAKVNGEEVVNLRHLVEMVNNNTNDTLRIEVDRETLIVLDAEQARTASEEILEQYRIPAAMSSDVSGEL